VNSTSHIVVLALVLALAPLPSPSVGRVGSVIRSGGPAAEWALQRAALRFFPPVVKGTVYDIVLQDRTELYDEQMEFERLKVQTKGGDLAGTFVRLKVFGAGRTIVDLALRTAGATVTAVQELCIPTIDGQAFPGLGRGLTALARTSCSVVAPPLAELFRSMTYVSRAADGTPGGPPITDAVCAGLVRELLARAPKVGTTVPNFALRTATSEVLTPTTFRGRPFAVVLTSLAEEEGRMMLTNLRPLLADVPVIEILLDTDEDIESFRRGGGALGARTVIDFEEAGAATFGAPVTPYLLAYDGQGSLALSTPNLPPAEFTAAVQGWRRTVGLRPSPGKATAGSSGPAPTGAAAVKAAVLTRALQRLFPDEDWPGRSYHEGQATELFAEGVEYTPLTIVDREGDTAACVLVRVRVRDSGWIAALATIAGEKVTELVPLDDVPVTAEILAELLAPLRSARGERWGPTMANLFRALTLLPAIAAGEPVSTFRPDLATPGTLAMTVEQPRPAPGDGIPAVAGRTVDGAKLPNLTGRPVLLLFADLRDGLANELRRIVYGYHEAHDKDVILVEIYDDPAAVITRRRDQGETFRGVIVADPSGDTARACKLPYRPYLLGYDGKGVLQAVVPYRGMAATRRALDEFQKSVVDRR